MIFVAYFLGVMELFTFCIIAYVLSALFTKLVYSSHTLCEDVSKHLIRIVTCYRFFGMRCKCLMFSVSVCCLCCIFAFEYISGNPIL